jgi:hypothetical protein
LSTQRFSEDSLTPIATATSLGEKNWLTIVTHKNRTEFSSEIVPLKKPSLDYPF